MEEIQKAEKDFFDTINVLNELAESFWEQGENLRACLTEAQIYTSASKVLGKTHPDTLKAMHNYALGLAKTGRDQEAADILNQYLDLVSQTKNK